MSDGYPWGIWIAYDVATGTWNSDASYDLDADPAAAREALKDVMSAPASRTADCVPETYFLAAGTSGCL